MRRRHFEALQPLCPVCRSARGEEVGLEIATVEREEGATIHQGVLRCTAGDCRREYPIIDGIPLIIPALRDYVAAHLGPIYGRDDLSQTVESILGDCCGPDSAFHAGRQQLSSYAWDHYGDIDPAEDGWERPGSVVDLLDRALALAGPLPAGPVVDLGCAVGRGSFELAGRLGRLVLGVDLNYAFLRLASEVLDREEVRYPRRRVGLVFERRSFPARFPSAEEVDFWACDATALPFAPRTFAAAAGLSLLDSVASPHDALAAMARVLAAGGKALLTCPYDWSAAVTPVEAWLGGHSQRGPQGGAGEPVLRALLTPGGHPAAVAGLERIADQSAVPWRVRVHERSTVQYQVDLVIARATGEP